MAPDEPSAPPAACPTIARYTDRFPALAEAVAGVLAAAAEVRAARDRAYPSRALPEPRKGPGSAARERALAEAVARLEETAASPAVTAEQAAQGVRRVLSAIVDLRAGSHGFAAARRTTGATARSELVRALRRFGAAYRTLCAAAVAAQAPEPPWQVAYATHVVPGTAIRELTITGYELAMTPAAEEMWGERCWLSGEAFATDSHTAPAWRYRALDGWSHVLAPRFYEPVQRLRTAVRRLGERWPAAAEEVARLAPAVLEDYVLERGNPTFVGLGLRDFPSFAVTLNNALVAYGARPLIGARGGGGALPEIGVGDASALARGGEAARSGYTWTTYAEMRERALRLAHGLESLGLREGERIGILATTNCPELHIADLAAVLSNLIPVGLQDTLGDGALRAVAAQAGLVAVVADEAALPRIAAQAFREACPDLRAIVGFRHGDGEGPLLADDSAVLGFSSLMTERREIPAHWRSASGITFSTGIIYGDADGYATAAAAGIRPDADGDIYTIIFTSGSTGRPKGAVVTRRRWIEEMRLGSNAWPHVDVSYRSPALASDRRAVLQALCHGGRIGCAHRGGAELLADIRAIRPTVLDAPPALWSIVADQYRAEIADPSLRPARIASIRRRYRRDLGGRLAAIGTGGATSDPAVKRTVEAMLGVPMSESYGTTETGEIADNGRLVAGLDYRLVDVPEMGFSAGDTPYPRGELAVRTPHITASYYSDERSSREGFTPDGYFLTGDIVEIGPGRACRVIGRRKEFFKLAGAEFVTPSLLEDVFRSSSLVDDVFVTGLPTERAVAAVVVPARGDTTEHEALTELRGLAVRAGLRACEVPAAVVIERRVAGGSPWTPESGLRTPSMKLCRPQLNAACSEAVAAAYAASASAAGSEDLPPGDDLEAGGRLLTAVVAAILAIDHSKVDLERSFLDHGGDSLSAIQFRLRLEQLLLGGEAPEGEIADLVGSPLRDIACRIAARRSAPRAVRPAAARAVTEEVTGGTGARGDGKGVATESTAGDAAGAAIADVATAPLPDPVPADATGDSVLLTGGTGFLGVHMIPELLATLPAAGRLLVLVRAATGEAARQRLLHALRAASLETPPVATVADPGDARLLVVAGTLDRDRFGLDDAAYGHLEREVGLIHHVAADVDFGRSYDALRVVNVEGARRVLELATTGALRALHFVSSLDVAPLLELCGVRPVYEGSVLPDRIPAAVASRCSPYALCKWVGESMVQRVYECSGGRLRASISRPALITWSSATGASNRSDWLTRLLGSCLEMRCALGENEVGVPAWSAPSDATAHGLDMVCVDFAARAVCRIGELTAARDLPPPTRGVDPGQVPTFHVSNVCPGAGGLVTPRHLMDVLMASDLAACGTRPVMAPLPLAEWTLRVEAEERPMLPLLPYLDRLLIMRPRAQSGRFAALIEGAGGRPAISCPPFDRRLMDPFVERCLADLPDPGGAG